MNLESMGYEIMITKTCTIDSCTLQSPEQLHIDG